jgi:hypothetical protein
MAALSRIKVGQTLYTVTRQGMGNTTMTRRAVHAVTVREINLEKRRVFASWNYNEPQWFSERQVARWKVKKPQADPL